MGPRKRLVPSGNRPGLRYSRERRTKARFDPVPSPSPSSSPPPASPSPPPASPPRPRVPPVSPAAERMAGRVISCGRRISFLYFDTHGFRLGDWIRGAGCEVFCSLSERYYPHLIREFYGSLGRGADGWTATVRGVTFILTTEVLSQILQIPSSGAVLDVLADRDDGIRCILERDDIRGVTTVTAVQLSVEMRLLHHVVARIFLPKTGRFDYITERELLIMTSLVRG